MSDNIFANAGQWTPVKVTDTTNILDTLAKAYDKQKESFKGLVTLHDDFWKTAQKQHQQDAVNALNNMSVDELTAVDANGLTAKQNYMNQLEQAGKQLGGYTNMTEMGTLFDTRLDSAIADENAIKTAKTASVQDAVNALIPTIVNVDGTKTPEEVQAARDRLKALELEYGGDVIKLNALNAYVPTAASKALEDKDNYTIFENKITENDYNSMVAPTMNNYIDRYGQAVAMLRMGESTGNKDLTDLGKKALTVLGSYFNVKGAKDADGKDIAEDGVLTSFMAKQPEKVRKFFESNKDAWIQASVNKHFDSLSKGEQIALARAKHQLSVKALEEEMRVNREGTFADQKRAEYQNNQNVVNSAVEAYKMENGYYSRNGDGSGTSGDASGKSSKKGTTYASHSGVEWINKKYADYGISAPVIQDADGNNVINKDNIITAINRNTQKILNPDISAISKEYAIDPWYNSREYTYSFGKTHRELIDGALNNFVFAEGSRKGEKLTDTDKVLLTARIVKMQGKGTGSLVQYLSPAAIKENLNQIKIEQESQISNMLNDVTATLVADFKNIKEGDVLFQLDLDTSDYARYLSNASLNAAKTVRDAYTKEVFKPTNTESSRRNPLGGNVRQGAPVSVSKSSTNKGPVTPTITNSKQLLRVGDSIKNNTNKPTSTNKSSPSNNSTNKKVPYRYDNNPLAGWYK